MDLAAKIHYEDGGWRAKAPLLVHPLKVTRVLFICISILARSLARSIWTKTTPICSICERDGRAGGAPANFSNFSVRCVRARARRARAAFAFDGDDFSGWPQSLAISVPRRVAAVIQRAAGTSIPFHSLDDGKFFDYRSFRGHACHASSHHRGRPRIFLQRTFKIVALLSPVIFIRKNLKTNMLIP